MAAIADLASTPSKINSVATIFTPDVYNKIGEPKSGSPAFNIGSAFTTRPYADLSPPLTVHVPTLT